MATFKACIRNKRSDGFYPVYIRIAHNDSIQYINTGRIVNDKGLRAVYDEKGKKQTEISDPRVLKYCIDLINTYAGKLNNINTRVMDCKTLTEYLKGSDENISFTSFSEEFINKMKNEGRENSAQNYMIAVNQLKRFMNREDISFKDITSRIINAWIDSMKDSARKKNLYPTCIQTIFKAGLKHYNDYDLDLIKISNNPFMNVYIPKNKPSQKRSVPANIIKKFLTSDFEKPKKADLSKKEIGQDVGWLIFCLAGINTADLYDIKESALKKDWKLCYNRKKTREKSDTGAYMEINVPEIIRPLFEKYKGTNGNLFSFSERYSDPDSFLNCIDKGMKRLQKDLGIEDNITTYVFRHSWATIAQNECGASDEQVAFALVHSSAHKVTQGYIRKDYTPVDILNKKVIDFVFGEQK